MEYMRSYRISLFAAKRVNPCADNHSMMMDGSCMIAWTHPTGENELQVGLEEVFRVLHNKSSASRDIDGGLPGSRALFNESILFSHSMD